MTRLMGIDSSTRSLAYCVIEDGKAEDWGKIEFDGTDIFQQCSDATGAMLALCKEYNPGYVVLEGAAYINNFAVLKKLAMIQGAISGGAGYYGIEVSDVPPVTWQKGIGNPPSNKDLRLKFKRQYPEYSKSKLKAAIRDYRKQVTMDIVSRELGIETDDDDIADSAGVSLYVMGQLNL